MAEILNKNDIERLQSKYFFYQKFNRSNHLYCSHNFPYVAIKNKIKQYVNNEQISEELANGICYFNVQVEGDFCNTLCDYFYYWIGDKIYNLSNSEDDFTKTINAIYTELSTYAKQGYCKCSSKHKTKENFENVKIAYEYYNDYETFKEQLKTNENLCNADYNDYLNKAVETYNSVLQDCTKEIPPEYCIQLNEFIPMFSVNFLSPLKCNLTNVKSEQQHMHSSPSMESAPLDVPRTIPPRGDLPEDAESISETTVTYVPEVTESASAPTDKYMSEIIANVSFPIGAASTMLLLYKFTPVGSFFRRNLGKNKVMDHTMNSSMIGAIGGDIYNNDQSYSGRHRYNLSYSPE